MSVLSSESGLKGAVMVRVVAVVGYVVFAASAVVVGFYERACKMT